MALAVPIYVLSMGGGGVGGEGWLHEAAVRCVADYVKRLLSPLYPRLEWVGRKHCEVQWRRGAL